eukprot:11073781-Alexandrium_andersonii.AAC.1
MTKACEPHWTEVKSAVSAGGLPRTGHTVPDFACQGRPAMATSVKPASVATDSASISAHWRGTPLRRQRAACWT